MTEPTDPMESQTPAETPDAPQADGGGKGRRSRSASPRKRHFRRTRALFAPVGRLCAKIPHPPWRSKRGIFVLVVLIGGFGTIVGIGGMTAITFSETPAFCGMCHTMDPELKAYAMSPHKEVTCAECHVEPGVAGFVKAKANGTKQLFDIVVGKFPTPIEPPDHADLPPVKDTCLKCHSLNEITENGGPVKLVLRPRYELNESNTKETVLVMLRPGGLGDSDGVLGVHWHVQQNVTYTTSDIRSRKIDLVEITAKDGTKEQYISQSQVKVSANVKPDIARLKLKQTTKRMDCIDCHNRIGHGIPSPDQAVDGAMAAGRISPNLPFIKRDSVALLNGDYSSQEAADAAIDGLRTTYAAKYPLVASAQAEQVTEAIAELKTEYRLLATPAMKVQAKTYPDNLGHQSSLGCFRCHDGAHYLVVKGKITNKTIPSECSTCHTFPQVGANASSFPLGAKPATHKDKLYVFSHKNLAKNIDPTGQSCGACHKPSYCENCHKSGAIKVTHDAMLYDHAAVAKAAGGTQSCTYCHQAVSCAKCHKGPVLGNSTPAMPTITDPKPVAAITRRTP